MKDATIPSRQDLIDAIEKGISAAGDKLSSERVDALRSYALTTREFVCGSWKYSGVSCPFAAVGGIAENSGATEFSQAYDAHLREIVGLDPKEMFAFSAVRSVKLEITDQRQTVPGEKIGAGYGHSR